MPPKMSSVSEMQKRLQVFTQMFCAQQYAAWAKWSLKIMSEINDRGLFRFSAGFLTTETWSHQSATSRSWWNEQKANAHTLRCLTYSSIYLSVCKETIITSQSPKQLSQSSLSTSSQTFCGLLQVSRRR